MVRKYEHSRFSLTFCKCRPDVPFRGKQYVSHRKKCAEEKLGEFRVCLKELEVLRPPFTNEQLEKFYATHETCGSGKVTSPRAKSFFASIFANDYVEGRQERREEMTVTLEDEGGISEESESEEESEEEREEEAEGVNCQETQQAVTAITEEILAPSLGEDFNWDDVDEWINKMDEDRKRKEKNQIIETSHTEPSHTEPSHTEPSHTEPSTTEHITPQDSTTQVPSTSQILTPAYTSQTHTIIKLKDNLSREEKIRKDLLHQVELLQSKLKQYENRFEEVKRREHDRQKEDEALNRAREVLTQHTADVERREKAVKEVDLKIQKEKKELFQERSKIDIEKEELRKARKKIDEEKTVMKEEREKMTRREEDLNSKGRTLRALFEQIKKEKAAADEEGKSLVHVPIKNGMLAGDPHIQELPCKAQECFKDSEVCGHIKIVHGGQLKIKSWYNKTTKRPLTSKSNYDSDSSDDFAVPPTKKMKIV